METNLPKWMVIFGLFQAHSEPGKQEAIRSLPELHYKCFRAFHLAVCVP